MNELKLSKRKQLQTNVYDVETFKKTFVKEADLQRQCEQYLEVMGIDYIRIPNAVYNMIFGPHSKLTGQQKSFCAKYLKGLKDLFVLVPDSEYVRGIVIELKSAKGKLSQGQKKKHRNLPTHIVRDFRRFEELINEFMKG